MTQEKQIPDFGTRIKKSNYMRIRYDSEERPVMDEHRCPVKGYPSLNDCAHPERDYSDTLECKYGLAELKVPNWCPFRKGPLKMQWMDGTQKTKTIELVTRGVEFDD